VSGEHIVYVRRSWFSIMHDQRSIIATNRPVEADLDITIEALGSSAAVKNAIHAAGITEGCGSDPLRYCPDGSVTRAEMATFPVRALDLPTSPQP